MGTSHRHIPGVTGEPNWGKASQSMTSTSKAIDESETLANNPPTNVSPKQIEKRQQVLNNRIRSGYHHTVRNLVRAAGGRSKVASGASKALGHAGISWATSFAGTFQDIAEQGLATWLESHGQHLENQSCHDLINIIGDFIGEYFVGLDDTAAQDALSHVLGLIENRANDDYNNLDSVFNEILHTEEIKDILDQFFGIYVYSHLSQNFFEKLEKERGTEVANQTMQEIKDLILDDVSRGINGRPAGRVNWKGEEGSAFIKSEFDRIIKILTNDED